MKTNKAPEKIYLYPSNIPDQEYEAEWGCMPWDESSVEYTRTDAFIDKAWDWLKNNIDSYYTTNEFVQWFDEMFKDFIEALKGE